MAHSDQPEWYQPQPPKVVNDPPRPISGLAVASVVISAVSVVIAFAWQVSLSSSTIPGLAVFFLGIAIDGLVGVGGLVAAIMGYVAGRRILRSGGGGGEWALLGVILGCAALVYVMVTPPDFLILLQF